MAHTPVSFLMSPRRFLYGRRFVFLTALLAIAPQTVWAQLDKHDTAPIAPAPVGAQGFRQPEHTVKILSPGVIWTQDILPADAPGGPLVVSVIRISPDAARKDRLHVALGYGHVWENNASQGREKVSGIAARNKALVAINASFFTYQSGHPLGICIENGVSITEPMLSRTAFCLDADGKGSIAAFTGSGVVTAPDGASFPISGFNRKPGKGNELLIFTPRFFDATLPAPERVEVALSSVPDLVFNKTLSGTVAQVHPGGGTSLAPQTVVLSGSGTAATFLNTHAAPGATWTFHYDVTPKLSNIRQVVAGGPRLVSGGRVAINDVAEGLGGAFSTTRHPRTAVGVTQDGSTLLLIVDGRQPVLSKGATLAETAALLVKYGAIDGVNLDGGGSTTLAVRGLITNSPSEGSERPVASALVLSDEKSSEKTDTLPTLYSSIYEKNFTNRGQVTNYPSLSTGEILSILGPSPLAAGLKNDPNSVIWGTSVGVGFLSQQGNFLLLRPGTTRIEAVLPDGDRYSSMFDFRSPQNPTLPPPKSTTLPTVPPTKTAP